MAKPAKKSTTVPLNWKEVWFTNCPMVSANNVDQELGWCREEFKKICVESTYFRHRNREEMQSRDRRLRNDLIATGC
jgi:hypothetical protein